MRSKATLPFAAIISASSGTTMATQHNPHSAVMLRRAFNRLESKEQDFLFSQRIKVKRYWERGCRGG